MLTWREFCYLSIMLLLLLFGVKGEGAKQSRTFYNDRVMATVRENVANSPQIAAFASALAAKAKPWRDMTYEQLWGLMFGPTLTRSWMVWSDGWCQAHAAHAELPSLIKSRFQIPKLNKANAA